MSELFDFKHITIMATGGRTDFMEPFIPNIKYQSDKFAVIEVSTVLKNGSLGIIGGNEFSLCSNENSTLHGERLVGYNFCVIQLGLPEGWRIYDANTIGRYTIAVYVEKLPVKETNEVS